MHKFLNAHGMKPNPFAELCDSGSSAAGTPCPSPTKAGAAAACEKDAQAERRTILVQMHLRHLPHTPLACLELRGIPLQYLPLSSIVGAARHVDTDLMHLKHSAESAQRLIPCFQAGFFAAEMQHLCEDAGISTQSALMCLTIALGDNGCTSIWFGVDDVIMSPLRFIPCNVSELGNLSCTISIQIQEPNIKIEVPSEPIRIGRGFGLGKGAGKYRERADSPSSTGPYSEYSSDSDTNSMYTASVHHNVPGSSQPVSLSHSLPHLKAPRPGMIITRGLAVDDVSGIRDPDSPYSENSPCGEAGLEERAARALCEARENLKRRMKGCTEKGKVCKELRNAVPAHLKKRKNRRAVIKTLKDLQEYMESIDPILQECGMCPEYCATAARTIGLSNTRFTELRRMWESFEQERENNNREIIELGADSQNCTLRKLVGVLEYYGHSCTSGPTSVATSPQPASSPVMSFSSLLVQAHARKYASQSQNEEGFGLNVDVDNKKRSAILEYSSPKRPRSVASSEDGHTSDEGDGGTSKALIHSIFKREPGPDSSHSRSRSASFFSFGDESEGSGLPDHDDLDPIPTLSAMCLDNSAEEPDMGMSQSMNSLDAEMGEKMHSFLDLNMFNEIEKDILADFM